ncbi:MAG: hypothetical protein KC593_21995 [Myxococcales bacterium]|nr:hypothetical protein [Myxococcales bacterium]MCB9625949.1 hypothetical protein [Sandaracinaceae bacterium]
MRHPSRTPLAVLLSISLALSTVGCGAGLTRAQRQQCATLRGQTAGRAVAGIIGSVVVLGVLVIASAALGRAPNFGNLGRGGRTRRANQRAARLAACRAPATPEDPEVLLAYDPNGPAPGEFAPTDIPIGPEEGGPPSVSELDAVFAQNEERVRACAPTANRVLYIDARVRGDTGAISGLVLGGEGSYGVSVRCVTDALSTLRVRPFDGVVDVRWAVDLRRSSP